MKRIHMSALPLEVAALLVFGVVLTVSFIVGGVRLLKSRKKGIDVYKSKGGEMV